MNTEAKNGCFNHAPYLPVVIVQTGWTGWYKDECAQGQPNRHPMYVEIPNPMEKNCQYTKSAEGRKDKRCTGCMWKITEKEVTA